MADDFTNEDSWLYGDSNADASEENQPSTPVADEKDEEDNTPPDASTSEAETPMEVAEAGPSDDAAGPETDPTAAEQSSAPETNGISEEQDAPADGKEDGAAEEGEEGTQGEEGAGEDEDSDDSDDDDDIQVTIGDIKTATPYTAINLKRGLAAEKGKQPGKFSIEEFEAVGTISGVPAHDFNLDSLEEKPWRKPGADITDYFNYGFNEDTWRSYCERQKRIRIHDSGVGLGSLGGGPVKAIPGSIPVTIVNDNSKYSGILGPKKAGPPPGRKFAGSIDVIGGNPGSSRRSLDKTAAAAAAAAAVAVATPSGASTPEVQESPIQVMTADRREYGGRPKPSFPDMSVPPPIPMPQFDMPPAVIESIPPYAGGTYPTQDFYQPDADPYYHSYEPTQDSQWGAQQPWEGGAAPAPAATTSVVIPLQGTEPASKDSGRRSSSAGEAKEKEIKEEPAAAPVEKERTEKHKDKHRHKSRSRSRSAERSSRSSKKRNKSRSRSPHRHRSKKKSRREREESE